MTGTERIRQRILSDASKLAAEIDESSVREANEILAEALAQRAAAEAAAKRQIEQMEAAQKQRDQATLQLETRKLSLAVKQQVVQLAFDKACEQIALLPDKTYHELVTAMLLSLDWQDAAALVVTSADRVRLGSNFPDGITQARAQKGLVGALSYSTDQLDAGGGFVLRTGEMEINGKLDVILSGVRPKLERQIAEILFGETV